MIHGGISLNGYDYVTLDLKAETDKWKFSCDRCGQRTNRSCTLDLAPSWCSSLHVPCFQAYKHNNISILTTFIQSLLESKETHVHACFICKAITVRRENQFLLHVLWHWESTRTQMQREQAIKLFVVVFAGSQLRRRSTDVWECCESSLLPLHINDIINCFSVQLWSGLLLCTFS